MDEGSTGLLEQQRPPEADAAEKAKINDPLEMQEVRNRVRTIDYGEYERLRDEEAVRLKKKGEKEKPRPRLPKNEQELRDALDQTVTKMIESKDEEIEHRKHVPDIVLRQQSEKQWEELGWKKADREKAISLLKKRLHLSSENGDIARAQNALDMLIASGKTAEEAVAILEDDSKYDIAKRAVDRMVDQDSRYEDIRQKQEKLIYLKNVVGVENGETGDYIQRYVLDDEFRPELDSEFDQQLPQNLYDLAWNMGYRQSQNYGLNGVRPTLQMQVAWEDVVNENGEKEIDEKTGKAKQRLTGRYVVNQSNLVHWLRDQMWQWYEGFDTQDATDYFNKVQLHKGQYATINLITMLFDKDRYWRDETGHMWGRLYDQVLLEPWMLFFLRTYAVEYDKVSGDDDKLVEAYQNLFHLSKLTMKIYGKSMIQILTTLPEDFEGVDSDTKVGEAWLKMFLAYYSLADFEELQKVLGKDSQFFTRKGWIEAAQTVHEPTAKRTHQYEISDDFFGERQRENWAKAFDEDGNVTTKENIKNFKKFINIYDSEHPSTNVDLTLAQVLKDAVSDLTVSKEGNLKSPEVDENNPDQVTEDKKLKDKTSLNYAWLIAHAWTHFAGALARGNFPSVSGHFAETKWFYTDAYRDKYMGFGGAGTFSAIPMFKQLSLPLMEGILLENSFMPYVSGYKEDGTPIIERRQMVPMEVFKMMNAGSNEREAKRKELREKLKEIPENDTERSKERRAQVFTEIEKVDKDADNDQKSRSMQLEFNQNAMRVYSKNLVGRGSAIYKQLMNGEETAFDKFTHHNGMFKGASFDRGPWQEELQKKYVTPLRYLFEANGATQLNMKQRFPVMVGRDEQGKPQYEWKTMYVGERMLGHQVLNIPTFRKQRTDVSDKKWEKMKELGYRKKGKYIVRPDGKYDINYNRVQENKPMVYKQFLLMKLAADLYQHIERHHTDTTYSLEHYHSIIKAIKMLPGNLDADEYNMQDARVTKPFFSEEQIHWLEKVSGAKKKWRAEFVKSLGGDPHKKEGGIGESTSIFLNAIFRGY